MSNAEKGDSNEENLATVPEIGERLVRVPLDVLQETANEKEGKL